MKNKHVAFHEIKPVRTNRKNRFMMSVGYCKQIFLIRVAISVIFQLSDRPKTALAPPKNIMDGFFCVRESILHQNIV